MTGSQLGQHNGPDHLPINPVCKLIEGCEYVWQVVHLNAPRFAVLGEGVLGRRLVLEKDAKGCGYVCGHVAIVPH